MFKYLRGKLTTRIYTVPKLVQAILVDIKSDNGNMFSEFHRDNGSPTYPSPIRASFVCLSSNFVYILLFHHST